MIRMRVRAVARSVVGVAALVALAAPSLATAQSRRERDRERERRETRRENRDDASDRCEGRGGWGNDDRERYCEVREKTLSARSGTITVDGGQNGGIQVTGWDRNEVLVRAIVRTQGEDEAEARELA